MIAALLMLLLGTDAEALRQTAPVDLTLPRAAVHLGAARAAASAYGLDPDLLLSIAWHESRYTDSATTPEIGGKVSCGALTPEPLPRCAPATLLEQYLAGAKHLRGWITAAHGDLHTALLGYAGGYALIRACQRHEPRHGCFTPEVFLARARWITRQRSRSGVS